MCFIGEWPAELLLVRELGNFQVPTTGDEVRARSIALHRLV